MGSPELATAVLALRLGVNRERAIESVLPGSGHLSEASSGAMTRAAQVLGGGALGAYGLFRLAKAVSSVPEEAAAGRALTGVLGSAIQVGSRILSHKITGATINALGGPAAVSGKGDLVRYSMTMNVPTPNMTTTTTTASGGGGGGGGMGLGGAHRRTTTTVQPAVEQAHFARFEAEPGSNGYMINLYREDPLTGERLGAPVRTFNARFEGSTPMSVQNLQNGIARTLAGLGEAIVMNRTMSRPPPIIVQRRPGRPPDRRLPPQPRPERFESPGGHLVPMSSRYGM